MNGLPKSFENHLKSRGVSQKTLRNYLSDLNHFIGWATFHLQSAGHTIQNVEDILPHFSGFLIANYKGYHLENSVAPSTTNRRLSTLRNFARFLLEAGYINTNPTQVVSNIRKDKSQEEWMEEILEDFKRHLEKEGVSKTTLKNYLSDTRQFLVWLNEG